MNHLQHISNHDTNGIFFRLNTKPISIFHDLQTRNIILKQKRDETSIHMWLESKQLLFFIMTIRLVIEIWTNESLNFPLVHVKVVHIHTQTFGYKRQYLKT